MRQFRILVDNLRISYSGIFSVDDFYNEVENWMRKNGMEKEVKMKREHVDKDSKKIEWYLEIWEKPAVYAQITILFRALMENVKEVRVKRGKHEVMMNSGNVLVIMEGMIETDIEGRWQQEPWFVFLRTIVDKYIYRFWTNRFHDLVSKKTYGLYRDIRAFFKSYEY